jgi:hypothetical protein
MFADEVKVKHWWNALTVEQRLKLVEEAGLLNSRLNQRLEWTQPWDELVPFSQQRALLHYYARKFSGG